MLEITANCIICFGDSITAGSCVEPCECWVSLLEGLLNVQVTVHNAGVGGNTSREGLARFDSDVKPLLPGLVIAEFGGNDATTDPVRHVSLEEFDANMRTMVRKIRSGGGDCALMTFPPVLDDKHSTKDDPFYDQFGGCDGYIEVYRDMTRALAKELGCLLIDLDIELRKVIAQLGEERIIMDDGVHLTVEGNAIAAEIVKAALES